MSRNRSPYGVLVSGGTPSSTRALEIVNCGYLHNAFTAGCPHCMSPVTETGTRAPSSIRSIGRRFIMGTWRSAARR
jgi:hypothetical protein